MGWANQLYDVVQMPKDVLHGGIIVFAKKWSNTIDPDHASAFPKCRNLLIDDITGSVIDRSTQGMGEQHGSRFSRTIRAQEAHEFSAIHVNIALIYGG